MQQPLFIWNEIFCQITEKVRYMKQRTLVGCPVGLEPTVSRSTIWRVNRLRYGHHINAPEGTRTPGPLLRRQLLYPPELRAHVVNPIGFQYGGNCVSEHVASSIIPYRPRSVKQISKILLNFFKKIAFERPDAIFDEACQSSHMPAAPSPKPSTAPATTSGMEWTPANTRRTQMAMATKIMTTPAAG